MTVSALQGAFLSRPRERPRGCRQLRAADPGSGICSRLPNGTSWRNFTKGIGAMRGLGAEIRLPSYFALLAETFGRAGLVGDAILSRPVLLS